LFWHKLANCSGLHAVVVQNCVLVQLVVQLPQKFGSCPMTAQVLPQQVAPAAQVPPSSQVSAPPVVDPAEEPPFAPAEVPPLSDPDDAPPVSPPDEPLAVAGVFDAHAAKRILKQTAAIRIDFPLATCRHCYR
jgi:hypothetical protein